MPTVILKIRPGSDGDGRRRPKTGDFTRNDSYWLECIAALWAKDLGQDLSSNTYRLDKLPDGYRGYEKPRSDSQRTDRYVYGHLRGAFRSTVEFYPHFKHLMDHGNSSDCACKLCLGNSKSNKGSDDVIISSRRVTASSKPPTIQSRLCADSIQVAGISTSLPPPRSKLPTLIHRASVEQAQKQKESLPRRKQVDAEGTPDAVRLLIDKLKVAGTESSISEPIVEHLSPDWHAGHATLMRQLQDYARMPMYLPRVGELVLFVRDLSVPQSLGWDSDMQSWRVVDENNSWGARPPWQAGVVAQVPTVPIAHEDLTRFPPDKHNSVVNAGFRIEPLSQPNSVTKSHHRQHRYVPLHATRPLALWRDCLHGVPESEWHPTIRHALSVASSHSILGRYHFKGTWPEATVFSQGIYIGPELICVGDTVRLYNRSINGEVDTAGLIDIMTVTAIRIRLVNLQEASDDDYDEGNPYLTCIHISGHAFTQDPTRSFDGVGKRPVGSDSPLLPAGIRELGTWYHMTDPKKTKTRLEVPYRRVIGRCYESEAIKAWFDPPSDPAKSPTSTSQEIHKARPTITLNDSSEIGVNISHGLIGILEARGFSEEHDTRIDKSRGKTWFWADTRDEQLDLHEVNGYFVGIKDELRSTEQMAEWRQALKAWGRGQPELAKYHAKKRAKEEEHKGESRAVAKFSSVMMTSAAMAHVEQSIEGDVTMEEGGNDEEENGDQAGEQTGDGMELEHDASESTRIGRHNGVHGNAVQQPPNDSEDEEETENALAAFRADVSPARSKPEVMAIDNDD